MSGWQPEIYQAAIYGLSGLELTKNEIAFFNDIQPFGYILFARNIDNASQLKDLTNQLRHISNNPETPILIDQEGGRVARLRPPLMQDHPPARLYGQIFDNNIEDGLRACFLGGQLIGHALSNFGINVNCLPCLDLSFEETSAVIGDRSYGSAAEKVAQLGMAAAQGLMEAGVLPVMKHLPGHGRGAVDSHLELPVVTAEIEELKKTDFEPFRLCQNLPLAMTGHLKFSQIDPEHTSTVSTKLIREIIREYIGFDGLLMSDDISMQALSGNITHRGLASLEAGCDIVLHCNGDFQEMSALGDKLPRLSEQSQKRLAQIIPLFSSHTPVKHVDKLESEWKEIISRHFPMPQDKV
ncbi:MAG: beta-N-acetylhexosaminidase [Parvibaculales bacterium]